MPDSAAPDSRFLEGIAHFNSGEFFEAHEVWEDWWHDTHGHDRRFIQGLIQAAVAIYHAYNGNALGTRRLFGSARQYMSTYAGFHLGLDIDQFWLGMEQALIEFLAEADDRKPVVQTDRLPRIVLSFPSTG